jgi:LCP family protein required for cell wall assembly
MGTGRGNENGAERAKTDKRNSPMRRFWKTFFLAFIVFLILCVPGRIMLGGVASYTPFDPEGDQVVLEDDFPVLVDENSPFFEAFQDKKRVNVLLLGINDGLSDTIILASFDMDARHVDLISVPRDTFYHRQGYNGEAQDKINAAYRRNPLNTAMAVSDILLGMPINYYAVVDYAGIETIVDSMDGVPMTIQKGGLHYRDPKDTPPLVIDIPEGAQILDGEHAVQFLRFRHSYSEGDIGRVKAQQEFMKSAFRQCLNFNLPKIAKTVFDNIDSDITLGAVTTLMTKAAGIAGDDITTYMLPATPQGHAPWYMFPDTQKIAEMINEIYSIEPAPPAEAATESAISGDED